jgi:hypothetical protein
MLDAIKYGALAVAIAAPAITGLWGYNKGYGNGTLETEARLTVATIQASEEISNEAERSRFLRRQCVAAGGVYDFTSRKCQQGRAN